MVTRTVREAMFICVNDQSLTGTWGNTSCPTCGIWFCRTPHHSTSSNPLSPLSSMSSPLMAHKGATHNFHHMSKCGPYPLGMPIQPHSSHFGTSVHKNKLMPSMVSITFSHRPDEAYFVRNQCKLVCVIIDYTFLK